MNKKELQQKLQEAEEMVAEVRKQLEEAEKVVSLRGRQGVYRLFSADGKYGASNLGDEFDKENSNSYSHNRYAQLQADKRNLEAKMQEFSDENGAELIDWRVIRQSKHCVEYDFYENDLRIDTIGGYFKPNVVYFHTKEIAQQAIDKFGGEIKRLALEEVEINRLSR
jgi:hypothetical protein